MLGKKENLKKKKQKAVVGWREWCELPDLGISKIKCKVDTGARTSSLHAYDVEVFRRRDVDWVEFKVHPIQRDTKKVVTCEALLIEWRLVTDSGGNRTLRPVIETLLKLGDEIKIVEVTLTARDEMGFRMLIGRQALKGHWLVDPAKSFLANKKTKRLKKTKMKKKTQ